MSAIERAKPKQAHQATAVPFRRKRKGIQFCLVTSSSGRWIFPKGLIGDDRDFAETALSEAHEEAGLHGEILDPPLGCYEITKDGKSLNVIAVLMDVRESDTSWKEDSWRKRRWASVDEARKLLSGKTYRELIDLALAVIDKRK